MVRLVQSTRDGVDDLELTLGDTALLARVQRPVASMWRTRSAGTDLPFPDPVNRVGAEERFSLGSVVDWLEATGRGRNPEVRGDAAAFASPPGISLREPTVHGGLTALLCLKALTDRDLQSLGDEDVRSLALATDPADQLLLAEIHELGETLRPLAAYADAVSDAAYGPARALERLLAQHSRSPAYAEVGRLAAPAHDLVSVFATSLGRALGTDPAIYVDASTGGSDLVLRVAQAEPDGIADLLLLDAGAAGRRLLLRRLRSLERHVRCVEELPPAGPAVVIAHHPVESRGLAVREQALDAIDELALALPEGQRALVLAPASLLIDRLTDRGLQQLRARVLRTGRVRAVVRLPAGLAPHRSREALALWVLSPDGPGQSVEDRRTAVADVSGAPLTGLIIDQLRDDVLAALAPPALARARSFALCRLVATSVVLAQSGGLIPFGAAAPQRLIDGRHAAVKIDQLRSRGNAADPLGRVTVEVVNGRGLVPLTLGQAVEQRIVWVISGNREGFALDPRGSLPVIGLPELTGAVPTGSRCLDRLEFLGSQSAARLTEPGDVVFSSGAEPRAVVDIEGGSAVQFPARILRIDPLLGEGLCSEVVAHAINSRTGHGTSWRSWLLPRVGDGQAAPLTSALSALAADRAALRQRLDELDQLRDAVINAVTTGALALTSAPDPKDD